MRQLFLYYAVDGSLLVLLFTSSRLIRYIQHVVFSKNDLHILLSDAPVVVCFVCVADLYVISQLLTSEQFRRSS